MDKRGFQLAINTLIIIILGLFVLIALTFVFSGGFKRFSDMLKGYSGNELDNLRKICKSQCELGNINSFCCEKKKLGDEEISCLDERLHVDCEINCEGVC